MTTLVKDQGWAKLQHSGCIWLTRSMYTAYKTSHTILSIWMLPDILE